MFCWTNIIGFTSLISLCRNQHSSGIEPDGSPEVSSGSQQIQRQQGRMRLTRDLCHLWRQINLWSRKEKQPGWQTSSLDDKLPPWTTNFHAYDVPALKSALLHFGSCRTCSLTAFNKNFQHLPFHHIFVCNLIVQGLL